MRFTRLTVASDVDVVIALPHELTYDEVINARVKVIKEAEE